MIIFTNWTALCKYKMLDLCTRSKHNLYKTYTVSGYTQELTYTNRILLLNKNISYNYFLITENIHYFGT